MKLRNRLPFFLRLLNKIRTLFGIPPLTLTNAKAGNLLGLTAYGGLEQNGTPTSDSPVPLICNNGEIKVDSNGNVYCDGLQETLRIVESNSIATTEMLLKLGDYVDSQDILNGIVNRNISITVLKGTEDWFLGNATSFSLRKTYFNTNSALLPSDMGETNIKCSHYKCSSSQVMGNLWVGSANINFYTVPTYETVANWKQWLADQYNNGTPVIVVCVCVPSTESTTPQPLTAVEGDNTLEIQQSSLSNLEVEATYEEK